MASTFHPAPNPAFSPGEIPMQATITYQLTAQAQRAQMAATGQPIARKQTITEDIPNELVASPLAKIDDAGNVSFPLDRSFGVSEKGEVNYGGPYGYGRVDTDFETVPASGASAILEVQARIDAHAARIRSDYEGFAARRDAEDRAEREHREAAKRERIAVRQALIDAFLADPAARATAIDSDPAYWLDLEGVRINKEDFGSETIIGLAAEARRRADEDKAAKEAVAAEKESAKLAYLHAWIEEHGTPSQTAREREGLLPREEAITALAEATFAPLKPQDQAEATWPARYTVASRPVPDCSDEQCDDDECQTAHSVEDGIDDGLSDSQYAAYAAIRAAMPGAACALRTHSAQHNCEHDDGCKVGSNYGCMVTVRVGPFLLQREYWLP